MRKLDYSWVILSVGFLVLFFSGGSRFAFGLLLKPMSDDLEWSRSSLSLAATAFMIVSALALPLVGRLVDKYSLRWIMAISGLIGAIGIGLMSTVTEPWHVVALYGFVYAMGFAGASVNPVGVMISRWFHKGRGMATSVAFSGNAVGQLVIIAVLASLLAVLGWRNVYTVLGLMILAIVPIALIFVRPASEAPPESETDETIGDAVLENMPVLSVGNVVASRQFWLLIAIYAICGFQDFFVATHIVAFALDQQVNPVLAGNMFALMGLLGLIGVLVSGAMSDKFGAAYPTGLCFLLRILIFGFIVYFQSTTAIILFALLYGFTFLITAPLTVIFAGNMFGAPRLGTVSGMINMVHQIAGGLGAFIGAVIFDIRGSYDGAFVLMFALAVVAAALTSLVRERHIQAESREPASA